MDKMIGQDFTIEAFSKGSTPKRTIGFQQS